MGWRRTRVGVAGTTGAAPTAAPARSRRDGTRRRARRGPRPATLRGRDDVAAEDLADVEQEHHPLTGLAHAEDELHLRGGVAERGRGLDLRRLDLEDLE